MSQQATQSTSTTSTHTSKGLTSAHNPLPPSRQVEADFKRALERNDPKKHSPKKDETKEKQEGPGHNTCNTTQTLGARILGGMGATEIGSLSAKTIDLEGLAQHIQNHFTEGLEEIHIDISKFIADTDVFITDGEIRFEASAESLALIKEHFDELKNRLERFGRIEIKESQEHGDQPDQHQGSRNQYVAIETEELEPVA